LFPAAESLVAFRRKDCSGCYRILDKIFSPHNLSPRVAVECDGSSSLITEVEIGRGIGIMRTLKGDITPAGEKFCEKLREVASR